MFENILKLSALIPIQFPCKIIWFPIKIYEKLRKSLKIRYQLISAQNYRGIKRIKHLIIPLLSQNIRKAHQLSVAMEKKGFKDGPRTYYYHAPFSYKDILLIIVMGLILISAYYLSLYFPITGIDDVRITSIY